MMTDKQKKESRRVRNHAYYVQNHVKWQGFYPKSTASELGTGNLTGHRLSTHEDEHKAVRAEMRRIGIRLRTQKYTKVKS